MIYRKSLTARGIIDLIRPTLFLTATLRASWADPGPLQCPAQPLNSTNRAPRPRVPFRGAPSIPYSLLIMAQNAVNYVFWAVDRRLWRSAQLSQHWSGVALPLRSASQLLCVLWEGAQPPPVRVVPRNTIINKISVNRWVDGKNGRTTEKYID